MTDIANVNCGVLGHIDSGKTSLCRVLHQVASTASMDKNPQSQERGITLDLGFSSFFLPDPAETNKGIEVTLVDCPGHASLIRTVLAGAQIIDVCILVVDAKKGFQTQTAECLVIAEILVPKLLIVVNKIDLIPREERDEYLVGFDTKLKRVMSKTRFTENVPIVHVSSSLGLGIKEAKDALSTIIGEPPARDPSGKLHFSFDHCFSVRGQGTVFTGTMLSGTVQKGQIVSLPNYQLTGEIRSIQKFRKSVNSASQGDRIGLCIPGIDSGNLERGDIYATVNPLISTNLQIFCIKKIKYFKLKLNQSKLHLTLGHEHAMGLPYFFRPISPDFDQTSPSSSPSNLSKSSLQCGSLLAELDGIYDRARALITSPDQRFEFIPDIDECELKENEFLFCVILFSKFVKCETAALLIASKLDLDEDHSGCRLAFFGRGVPTDRTFLTTRVMKYKKKEGLLDRYQGDDTFLIRGLLTKKNSDPSKIVGLPVRHDASGISGKIESTFGKSGLLKVRFNSSLPHNSVGSKVVLEMEKPALANIVESHST
jgi:selenocysteine-specific elongation factor